MAEGDKNVQEPYFYHDCICLYCIVLHVCKVTVCFLFAVFRTDDMFSLLQKKCDLLETSTTLMCVTWNHFCYVYLLQLPVLTLISQSVRVTLLTTGLAVLTKEMHYLRRLQLIPCMLTAFTSTLNRILFRFCFSDYKNCWCSGCCAET